MDIVNEVIKHLSTNVKTKIGVSSIDGVGVFAIRDIKQYEEVFPIWDYETGIYLIPNDRLDEIPKEVIELLDKVGAKQGSSVSKNTCLVIRKSKEDNTSKVEDAFKLNIPVLVVEEFLSKYK